MSSIDVRQGFTARSDRPGPSLQWPATPSPANHAEIPPSCKAPSIGGLPRRAAKSKLAPSPMIKDPGGMQVPCQFDKDAAPGWGRPGDQPKRSVRGARQGCLSPAPALRSGAAGQGESESGRDPDGRPPRQGQGRRRRGARQRHITLRSLRPATHAPAAEHHLAVMPFEGGKLDGLLVVIARRAT